MDWQPIILTLKLAASSTVILLGLAIPMAYWLSGTRSRIKPFIETLVAMPLILPPTVLGFYLLIAFSPSNAFGEALDKFLGIRLVFSFTGLVIASVVYSLPFMVHPIQSGLSALSPNLKEASSSLGKSAFHTLWRVQLPCIKTSLLTGIVLSFAHTIGEFGVVLMLGGNIPGLTKVASIAIYEEVESMNYAAAHSYSLILFLISFFILLLVYSINGSSFKKFW